MYMGSYGINQQSLCWPGLVGHVNGDHQNSRYANLQALHGHCYDAKTRQQGDYRPLGMRDKHQNTEERCEAKASCPVLEQRWAE